MADYFPVISRAVSGLDPNTGEARRKVYERARAAIVKQLRAIEPPVSEDDISRERMQLEEAIRRVEADAAGGEAPKVAPVVAAAPRPQAPTPAPPPQPQAAPIQPPRPQPPEPRPAANAAAPSTGKQDAIPDRKQAKRAAAPGQARPATRADGRPIVQTGGAGKKTAAKRRSGPLIALGALAAIAVVAGLFAARGQIASLFAGKGSTETAQTTTDAKSGDNKPADAKPEDAKPADQAVAPSGDAKNDAKSDDRLPQDQANQEQPAQPAEPAAPPADQQARAPDATTPAPAPAQPPADGPAQSGPLVAQRAVLYEEGPNQQSGEALTGSILWRTESVSGGSNQPLDMALKGEIEIPARNLRAVVTIRRNTDATLPASHTIEVQFKLPPDFPNAGVSNVPGVLMKTDESARGAAVSGLSVKVTNGFFLIGLSNVDSERSVNEQLLRDRSWIDIPILYDNGRRAVLTLEKGTPGKQAFDQAFDAWKSASSAGGTPR